MQSKSYFKISSIGDFFISVGCASDVIALADFKAESPSFIEISLLGT